MKQEADVLSVPGGSYQISLIFVVYTSAHAGVHICPGGAEPSHASPGSSAPLPQTAVHPDASTVHPAPHARPAALTKPKSAHVFPPRFAPSHASPGSRFAPSHVGAQP